MQKIQIIFHNDLKSLVNKSLRSQIEITVPIKGVVSLKHIVESLGVPHTEIGRVTLNQETVTLMRRVKSGDQYELFPDIPAPNTAPAFIADNHLGRLAEWLRLLGFDTTYYPGWNDIQIAHFAFSENRVLLSRDRGLLKRKIISQGYCIRNDDPSYQLREVVKRYHLFLFFQPFSRCQRCNSLLEKIEKSKVLHNLEPLTRKYYDEFMHCPQCSQVYWKGSHYQKILKTIQSLSRDFQEE